MQGNEVQSDMKIQDKLPIGIENFKEIRTQGFYYVDKTGMITDLLHNWGKVNLFTRPRRFGKSLNMSMLQHFFEPECERALFEGLKIAKEEALCEAYMGQFPVVSVTLKGVSGKNYEAARNMMCSVIGREAMRFQFLLESDRLSETDKKLYRQLITVDEGTKGSFLMSDATLTDGLFTLSKLLARHYGQKVIILIDEYDVPLDKAYQCGYYEDMVSLLRGIFLQALKGNDDLMFSVLTGCLRVSKESIFTGLNNPKVLSITKVQFDEYFGFTDTEVKELLAYYDLTEHYETVREWYDGYRFGNVNVYCPWDVINYCDELRVDPYAQPQDYWSNTSSNDIVRRFIDRAQKQTQEEIERLIAGETIIKEVRQELTYKELDDSIDNLWSVLFTTGYLTQRGRADGKKMQLAIPNMEVKEIFITQIKEWFQKIVQKDENKLDAFCNALGEGDAETAEKIFNGYLKQTISIRDTSVRKERKENFYHGILLGILSYRTNWSLRSNEESGDGYSDILIRDYDAGIGIVIEVKYAERKALEAGCRAALKQIEEQRYAETLLEDGIQRIMKYGVACNRKNCKIMLAE